MSPNDVPAPPPYSASIDEWKRYIRYLMVEIELRNVKHERLTHHVAEHCQG